MKHKCNNCIFLDINCHDKVSAYALVVILFIGIIVDSIFASKVYGADFGAPNINNPVPPGPPPGPPGPPGPPEPKNEPVPGSGTPPPPQQEDCDNMASGDGQSGESGGPVSLFSGYESFGRTDIVVKGLFDIEISRKYNSQSTYDSPLGYGWALKYDQRLFEYPDPTFTTPNQSVVIRYGCGRKDRFILQTGVYQTPLEGLKGVLTALPAGEYLFTHLSGMKDFYDAEGRFVARENVNGVRLEFSYDVRGKLPLTGASPFAVDPNMPMLVARHYRLTKIEERDVTGQLTGNFIDLVYDENTGRLRTVTDNNGRQITYLQDVTVDNKTLGNLETVNGLNGVTSTYIYNDDVGSGIRDIHNITTIQEGSEAPYVNVYDTQDRVLTQTHTNSLRTFEYVIPNLETKVTTRIWENTDIGNGFYPYDIEEYYWFDPVTEKVSVYEDGLGNRYEYDYDAFYNLDETRIFFNEGTKVAPLLVPQKTIDYTFNSSGQKTAEAVTLATGEVITRSWTYDFQEIASKQVVSSLPNSKVFRTEYTFNYVDGLPYNIKEVKRLKDDGITFQTTSLFYDSKGRIETIQYPDGHRKHYQYDDINHPFVSRIYHEIGNTGVESPFLSFRFDYDSNGNVTDIWDADNNYTQRVFDERNRLTKITNALNEETILAYANDRLQTIELGKTAAGGEGQIIKVNYNADNRIQSIQMKNDSGVFIDQDLYTYDSEGRVLTHRDGEYKTTTYEYDNAGFLSKVVDPSLKETKYRFDATGRLISLIDGNNNETKYTFDALQRCIQVEKIGSVNLTMSFGYDANNNRTSFTDGDNKTTTFEYDTLSRLKSETQQLGQTIQYFYNERNRIDYIVNGRNKKIDFTYYDWGKLEKIEYYDNPTTTTVDRVISSSYTNAGKISSVTDSDIAAGQLYGYTYDSLNRLDITTISGYPGATVTLDNNYDRFGNRDELILTDAAGMQSYLYVYDKLNNLVNATLPDSQILTGIKYFSNNMLEQITTPSGVVTDYIYEDNGYVKDIKITDQSSTLEQLMYAYDNNNNVDSINSLAGFHDFSYDNINRITRETHPSGLGISTLVDYAYDSAGNREDPADLGFFDYDNNNRITLSPGFSNYSHDDDGNMLTKGVDVFTYNHVNRISSYSDGANSAAYKYDPFGRRVSKTVNGLTTWFVWDETRLLSEYDNTMNQIKRYAYLGGSISPIQMKDNSGLYDIHIDHVGMPRLMTDASKAIVWRAHYDTFGVASINNDVDGDLNTVELNIRFAGQHYDPESARHYNFFRDYDPSLGRYIQADPLRLNGLQRFLVNNFQVGDMNLYTYVRNNPLRWIDPLGLTPPIDADIELELTDITDPNNPVPIPVDSTDPNNPVPDFSNTEPLVVDTGPLTSDSEGSFMSSQIISCTAIGCPGDNSRSISGGFDSFDNDVIDGIGAEADVTNAIDQFTENLPNPRDLCID